MANENNARPFVRREFYKMHARTGEVAGKGSITARYNFSRVALLSGRMRFPFAIYLR